ncbi:putative N-acetyltransferase YsnE [Sulfitobacter sp. DSM 110093]|uniref:GNAT family N-acetyltransferase n=1 Tax=Sulfitobacter sp. DSM 110093 TaxID=2883127 RepID=UPI001FAD94D1|nr:GNAT family N-acetyltransferase [Sulfitobacter sp. DSM 110093]UOA31807.1 putative N-acetyltransferase YsnE [Sulfitobacter sp. DSM 110093]
MSKIDIRPVTTAADLAAVVELCWAYRDFLYNFAPTERRIVETFYPEEKYSMLMGRLAEEHARPLGVILLAEQDGKAVGCGMSHALSGTESEIKRVYVTDAARGTGAGRAICQRLIDQARADGFEKVYLDTSVAFAPARALYRSLGFFARGPYQPMPDFTKEAICFYELPLIDAVPSMAD